MSETQDQVLRVVDALRSEVLPVLAPPLAYHVDLACRLIEGYRMRERGYQAVKRSELNHE